MAVKFEFYMSDKDFDRLCYAKNFIDEKKNLTCNEYAKELLENVLYSKCPNPPKCDESY